MKPDAAQFKAASAPTATPPRIYNRPAAEAKRLGVCLRTLCGWMFAGIIPYRKIGKAVLIDPREVDEALQKFSVNTPPIRKRRAGRIGELQEKPA